MNFYDFSKELLQEARRGGYPKTPVIDELEKYKDDPDTFLSFRYMVPYRASNGQYSNASTTDSNKVIDPGVGINPKSTYETPNGIYGYNIHDTWDIYFKRFTFPYASEAENAYVYRIKPQKGVKIIDSGRFVEFDYLTYESKISDVFGIPVTDISDFMIDSPDEYTNTPFKKFWTLTRHVSKIVWKRNGCTGRPANTWSSIFIKLGIGGVIDRGTGTIHKSEPHQAVFFGNQFIEVLDMFRNKRWIETVNASGLSRNLSANIRSYTLKDKNSSKLNNLIRVFLNASSSTDHSDDSNLTVVKQLIDTDKLEMVSSENLGDLLTGPVCQNLLTSTGMMAKMITAAESEDKSLAINIDKALESTNNIYQQSFRLLVLSVSKSNISLGDMLDYIKRPIDLSVLYNGFVDNVVTDMFAMLPIKYRKENINEYFMRVAVALRRHYHDPFQVAIFREHVTLWLAQLLLKYPTYITTQTWDHVAKTVNYHDNLSTEFFKCFIPKIFKVDDPENVKLVRSMSPNFRELLRKAVKRNPDLLKNINLEKYHSFLTTSDPESIAELLSHRILSGEFAKKDFTGTVGKVFDINILKHLEKSLKRDEIEIKPSAAFNTYKNFPSHIQNIFTRLPKMWRKVVIGALSGEMPLTDIKKYFTGKRYDSFVETLYDMFKDGDIPYFLDHNFGKHDTHQVWERIEYLTKLDPNLFIKGIDDIKRFATNQHLQLMRLFIVSCHRKWIDKIKNVLDDSGEVIKFFSFPDLGFTTFNDLVDIAYRIPDDELTVSTLDEHLASRIRMSGSLPKLMQLIVNSDMWSALPIYINDDSVYLGISNFKNDVNINALLHDIPIFKVEITNNAGPGNFRRHYYDDVSREILNDTPRYIDKEAFKSLAGEYPIVLEEKRKEAIESSRDVVERSVEFDSMLIGRFYYLDETLVPIGTYDHQQLNGLGIKLTDFLTVSLHDDGSYDVEVFNNNNNRVNTFLTESKFIEIYGKLTKEYKKAKSIKSPRDRLSESQLNDMKERSITIAKRYSELDTTEFVPVGNREQNIAEFGAIMDESAYVATSSYNYHPMWTQYHNKRYTLSADYIYGIKREIWESLIGEPFPVTGVSNVMKYDEIHEELLRRSNDIPVFVPPLRAKDDNTTLVYIGKIGSNIKLFDSIKKSLKLYILDYDGWVVAPDVDGLESSSIYAALRVEWEDLMGISAPTESPYRYARANVEHFRNVAIKYENAKKLMKRDIPLFVVGSAAYYIDSPVDRLLEIPLAAMYASETGEDWHIASKLDTEFDIKTFFAIDAGVWKSVFDSPPPVNEIAKAHP